MTCINGDLKDYKRTAKEDEQLGKETAARFSDGKVRHDLIPPWVLELLAKVYTYGTIKYDDDNWWKGLMWKKNVIGPMLRHMWKWIRGAKLDEESNCHHLAMVIWQCCCLIEYERNNIGVDDRVPYTLDLMDEEEREKRIKKWKELNSQGKGTDYNGLDV